LFGLLQRFLLLFVVLLTEIFFLKTGKLVFFLFALPDVFFGRVISDELVAVVLFALEFKVFIAI